MAGPRVLFDVLFVCFFVVGITMILNMKYEWEEADEIVNMVAEDVLWFSVQLISE